MIANYKPELYKKTVDILFDAYFNDTLELENCFACAVGNIVAANLKVRFTKRGIWECGLPIWKYVFVTKGGVQQTYPALYFGEYRHQIDSTGYSWQELAKVEFAFEMAPKGDNKEDYMFNGLVNVLEVLKDIHQVTEDEETLPRFSKHYKSKVA